MQAGDDEFREWKRASSVYALKQLKKEMFEPRTFAKSKFRIALNLGTCTLLLPLNGR
jgi:hypothetical protein